MSKFTLLFLLSISPLVLVAQKKGPEIRFQEIVGDLGRVQETGGIVTHVFRFKNTGDAPLEIRDIKTSCGCTTPEYTKDPVRPGREGEIVVAFDPKNRDGHFDNGITVFHNAEPNLTILRVRGNVIPRPRTVADDYPYKLGNLRMKINVFKVGDIYHNQKDSVTLVVYNDGSKPVSITNFNAPDYIWLKAEPRLIPPRKKGNITLYFDATKKEELGRGWDAVELITNDELMEVKRFNAIYTVKQFFPAMSAEELANAPKIVFGKDTHNFGVIRRGQSVSTEFTFKNEGNTPLVFYQIKSGCGCTAYQAEKTSIGPGEESFIKATYKSTGPLGPDSKDITIWTNDPDNPVVTLTVIVNVKSSTLVE